MNVGSLIKVNTDKNRTNVFEKIKRIMAHNTSPILVLLGLFDPI